MKKLSSILIFAVIAAVLLCSCSKGGNITTPAQHKVIFMDGDKTVFTYYVDDGKDFPTEKMPAPVQKTGYNVSWSDGDLKLLVKIKSDITVKAVYAPCEYKITFDTGNFGEPISDMTVTYGSAYNLPAAKSNSESKKFGGWKSGNDDFDFSGVWNVAENVTLSAEWTDRNTVTFKYGNDTLKILYVNDELTIDETQIPTVIKGRYYNLEWSRTDFTNVTEDISVELISKTPYEYKITYDYGSRSNDKNLKKCDTDGKTVKYGEKIPALYKPSCKGYVFIGWKDEAGKIVKEGERIFDYTSDIKVVAAWEIDLNDDDNWTDFY